MFGNSEASDTHIIARGASLQMDNALSTEFFTMNDPGKRNQPGMKVFDAPANALEDISDHDS